MKSDAIVKFALDFHLIIVKKAKSKCKQNLLPKHIFFIKSKYGNPKRATNIIYKFN